jgi:hypothetical protein
MMKKRIGKLKISRDKSLTTNNLYNREYKRVFTSGFVAKVCS